MKPRELSQLLYRAAAVIEVPQSETEQDKDALVHQLVHEADQLMISTLHED